MIYFIRSAKDVRKKISDLGLRQSTGNGLLKNRSETPLAGGPSGAPVPPSTRPRWPLPTAVVAAAAALWRHAARNASAWNGVVWQQQSPTTSSFPATAASYIHIIGDGTRHDDRLPYFNTLIVYKISYRYLSIFFFPNHRKGMIFYWNDPATGYRIRFTYIKYIVT